MMSLWMCVLLAVIAGIIDWSGVGPNAARDRVAAILYLASALGWVQQLHIDRWELEMLRSMSHDWRIIWSMAGVIPVAFWIFAMLPALRTLGRLGQTSFRGGGRPVRPGAASGSGAASGPMPSAARINGKLLSWTVGVALATPLAMPSSYAGILDHINSAATTTALSVGSAVAGFFGWS